MQVGRYIHRNRLEVKGSIRETLDSYRHSSYLAYMKKARTPDWLMYKITYRLLGKEIYRWAYWAFVLQSTGEETEAFCHKGSFGGVVGDRAFRQIIIGGKENLENSTRVVEGSIDKVASSMRQTSSLVEECPAEASEFGECRNLY